LVIKNVSRNADNIIPYRRDELNINSEDLLVILQGTGINMDKGAEELIDAVNITIGVTLLIVGSGDIIPDLKIKVAKLNIENKVIFIPTLPWDSLMKYTKSADIGICMEKDTNLSYRYSLPNKLFDYIAAGLPVIASDLPETGRILREFKCGIIVESITPSGISAALCRMKSNREELDVMKSNSVLASRKLNWEVESAKVTGLYNRVLTSDT